ncbi:MAG: hypothetical protein R3D55_10085 [Chloroflexota bacterium]
MKITPTTVVDFKQARPEDLPVVVEILAEAAVPKKPPHLIHAKAQRKNLPLCAFA